VTSGLNEIRGVPARRSVSNHDGGEFGQSPAPAHQPFDSLRLLQPVKNSQSPDITGSRESLCAGVFDEERNNRRWVFQGMRMMANARFGDHIDVPAESFVTGFNHG
jgi:hypothetical protein